MPDDDAALGHHLHKISIRQPIGDVPPHTQFNDVGVEHPPAIDRVPSRPIGFVILHSMNNQPSHPIPLNAPEPLARVLSWELLKSSSYRALLKQFAHIGSRSARLDPVLEVMYSSRA